MARTPDSGPSLDEMADDILNEIEKNYLSGTTGQGETHQRGFPEDPAFSVHPNPRLTYRERSLSQPPLYPPRLRNRIPDKFETDFLDCKVCRSLSLEGWYSHVQTPSDEYTYDREHGHYILQLKDLEETWQKCPICRVLRDLILPFGKENKGLNDPDVNEYITVRPGFGGNGNVSYTRESDNGFQNRLQRLCYHREGQCWFDLDLDIRPWVWPWINEGEAAETATKWLTKCLKDHKRCSPSTTDTHTLPARLMDIGFKEGDPNKIITTQPGQRYEYVALSYCWGNSQSLKLTSETIELFSIDIEWDKMPSSWQDTIYFIEKMKIQYLWIDAICILQDSAEDWAIESSKMGRIYQNAHFVISADVASGDKIGFLEDRSVSSRYVDLPTPLKPEHPDLILTVCEQSEGGHPDPIHDLFWDSEWGYNGEKVTENPKNHTFHRGWCLQERYLATRVLHFTSSEMFWECREKTYCECGFSPRDRTPRKRLFHQSHLGVLSRDKRLFSRPLDPWWELVREYTGRGLSFESDRLTALSGMAREFQDSNTGEYVVGMWRKRLPHDLLWSISYNQGRRTEKFVAPSWSWASVVGSITRMQDPHPVSLVEIVNVICEPTNPGGDQYGNLKGGLLRLRAPVIRGGNLTQRRKRNDSGSDEENRRGRKDDDFEITIENLPESVEVKNHYLDDPSMVPKDQKYSHPVLIVPLVQTAQKSDVEQRWVIGLLLMASEKWDGDFERIGLLSPFEVGKEVLGGREELVIR